MTANNVEEAIKHNFDTLVKCAGDMLQSAQNESATPQDVINVLDSVVDQLTEIKAAIPGGQSEQSQAAPPGQKPEPVGKSAKTETDTAEEGREKVEEQNKAQEELKSMKLKVAELTKYQEGKEREEVATEWSELFEPRLRAGKFDEVMKSPDPLETWITKIDAISEYAKSTNSVRPARNENVWIPFKGAKQISSGLKRL